jgi:hypothetical protein
MTLNSLAERRVITTNSGFIGLLPEEAQDGDSIAIVLGCYHPVVLRPSGDEYKVLGECYVHGLMDGEVFDLAESGELLLETIGII